MLLNLQPYRMTWKAGFRGVGFGFRVYGVEGRMRVICDKRDNRPAMFIFTVSSPADPSSLPALDAPV